ncbi:MAG: DNA-processing protein DprA [Thermodesulforhabdaceae bacterium]
MDKRKIAWLTLALIPELGPRSLWKLYRAFGGAEEILSTRETELMRRCSIRARTARAIVEKRALKDPFSEWDRLQACGVKFITWEDEEYPALLRHIPDPPLFLFAKGSYRPEHAAAVAIVGTRKASARGLMIAERLATDLARHGITVVSGLAIGIDSAAHRGALKAGGDTIAVMGSGLDVPYPRVNRDLIEQIAGSGVVFSEYPLGTPPEKWRFPLRNRIVSGLSAGVVVVEAGLKSGALITARLALEQGREVFAVPGPVGDERAAGANKLIKEGAKLVEDVRDIMEECASWFKDLSTFRAGSLRPREIISASPEQSQKGLGSPRDEELKILQVLGSEPEHIDKICEKTGLACASVLSLLTMMELKGLVRQLPGKYFIKER